MREQLTLLDGFKVTVQQIKNKYNQEILEGLKEKNYCLK